MSYNQAIVLAACTPTCKDPTNPGPWVKAIASISSMLTLACSNALLITNEIFSTWILLATSGTTPPYNLWIFIWLETTLDSISLPFLIIAQAVSSQLDSIAKIYCVIIYPP